MTLIEKWSNEFTQPEDDIEVIVSNHNETDALKLLNGYDSLGFVNHFTPCMLLWRDHRNFHKKALCSLLEHGVDININGNSGYNSLHLLIYLLFYGEHITIHHIEFWLSVGADINKKAIWYKNKKDILVLSPFNFFQAILQNTMDISPWFSWSKVHPKRTLSEFEITWMYYLFLCHDTEIDPGMEKEELFLNCHAKTLHTITESEFNHYPILQKYVGHYLHTPFDMSFQQVSQWNKVFVPFDVVPEEIYINREFTTEINSPPEFFYHYQDHSIVFHFYKDILPKIIQGRTNPYNNSSISRNHRVEMIQLLQRYPPFLFRTQEEIVNIFPSIFFPSREPPTPYIVLLNEIIPIMQSIHPYSNIFLIKNMTDAQVEFVGKQLSEYPYLLLQFQDQCDKLDLVKTIYYYLSHENRHLYINRLYFGFEQCIEDIKSYQYVKTIFKKQNQNFEFAFTDILMNIEICLHLIERVSETNFYEMELVWFRIVNLHCIEEKLGEHTWPLLLIS